jgi:hypothetical protein
VWDVPRIVVGGLRPELTDAFSEDLAHLISDCWLHTASRRPKMADVVPILAKVGYLY